jgi:pimeloyl-ACP methyl ester carboxylesterase
MPDITVRGIDLHYTITGTGPAVVLIHGWPFTGHEWQPLAPLLAAGGYQVIVPDLRGCGDSAKPTSGYTKRDVAEDLSGLMHALGHRTARVVGSDIGAMVAQAWALAHPGEIERLVLAESTLPGFGLEQIMNFAAGGSWHFGFHAQVDLAEMLTAGKEEAYLDGFWRLMSRDGLDATARAEYLRSYSAPGGMRGGFQHYSTLLTDGQAARAAVAEKGRLPMPVLVLNGEFGLPQAPLLDGARQLATDVRADTIPGSSHTIGSDNPAWLAERLIGFFGPDIAAPEDQGRPDASRE